MNYQKGYLFNMKQTIQEGDFLLMRDNCKVRPWIVLKIFTNTAGVPYNILVLPITTSTSVGFKNLVKIEHPDLKETSYAKLNSIQTLRYRSYQKIDRTNGKENLDKIKKKLKIII